MTIKEILSITSEGPVSVYGWVKTQRASKTAIFLEITDGSCQDSVQAVFDLENWDEERLKTALTGTSLKVTGLWLPSPAQGQAWELKAEDLHIYSAPDPATYPLQKKRHSFEFLREWTHLRARTNTFAAINRVRNTLAQGVHQFFHDRGFFWVHTPIITTADAEGAGQMFSIKGSLGNEEEFFSKPAHLSVSGQLNAEALALAMGRVYTFGPTFRAENSNTVRHLSEFWMIEPEAAFFDLEDDLELAESFVRFLIQKVLEVNPKEMAFFEQWVQQGLIESLEKVAGTNFTRMTYSEAVKVIQEAQVKGRSFEYPVSWGSDLQSEHERFLTDEVAHTPVIVTDYPKTIKAFYMKANPDGKTVRAMDVLVPRLGEIIGGSQREDDLETLTSRMVELGLNPEEYAWYLDLRRYGSVPHAGFGLGFDRLIQYVTGMQNIRDVIPFPRAPRFAPC